MTKLLENWEVFSPEIKVEEIAPAIVTEDVNGNKIETPAKKKMTMKGILQKADTLNQNGRIYPLHILEREVKNYQKFIIENRALGECVPPGTEIFTCDGWKNIESISDDERIFTLNLNTNEIEPRRINHKIVMPFDGELLRFKNSRSYDMCLTPNHRVLVWDRKGNSQTLLASELYEAFEKKDSLISHSSLRRSGGNWVGETPDNFSFSDGINVDSFLWAAFLGIYLSEGHSSGVYAEHKKNSAYVVITQNKGETADAIRDLLQKMPWSFSEIDNGEKRLDFVIKNKALHEHLISFGGSRDKFVPLYTKSWSTDLQQVMLDWMLLGDGRHRKDGKGNLITEYCTSSPRLANDVSEIMFKLGFGATTHTWQPADKPSPDYSETGRMILAENQAPMNIVYQHSSKGISLDFRFMKVEKVPYKGNVYCVNVQNGTWLMRYNGKVCWTHNCDHPDSSVINLKNVSHVVREAYLEGNVVRGTVEILDTPSGKILQSLVESGIKLGISSRGVGSTRREGDYYVVLDDFQLICWDFVSEPSTPNAFMMSEGVSIKDADVKKIFNKSDRINRIVNDILSLKEKK
jgi:hypothetical protein